MPMPFNCFVTLLVVPGFHRVWFNVSQLNVFLQTMECDCRECACIMQPMSSALELYVCCLSFDPLLLSAYLVLSSLLRRLGDKHFRPEKLCSRILSNPCLQDSTCQSLVIRMALGSFWSYTLYVCTSLHLRRRKNWRGYYFFRQLIILVKHRSVQRIMLVATLFFYFNFKFLFFYFYF